MPRLVMKFGGTSVADLDRIRNGVMKPVTSPEFVVDAGSIAVIDGHDGVGHVVRTAQGCEDPPVDVETRVEAAVGVGGGDVPGVAVGDPEVAVVAAGGDPVADAENKKARADAGFAAIRALLES